METDGRLTLERYWEPDWNAEADLPPGEDVERLRALLAEAVAEQMISDVPLGAFLSGGIDSTVIVGLMQRASSRPVKTLKCLPVTIAQPTPPRHRTVLFLDPFRRQPWAKVS